MTTPTEHGADYAVAVKGTNAWNQAAEAVGAGDGYRPNWPGHLPTPGRTFQDNPAVPGTQGGRFRMDPSTFTPSDQLSINLPYDGAALRWLGMFFGTVAKSTPGVNDRRHLFTFLDDICDRNLCYVARKPGLGIVEVDSAKVDSFNIAWTNGGKPVVTVTPRPRRVVEPGESGYIVNSDTEINAVTVLESLGDVQIGELTVRLAAQDGSTPLGAGNVIAPRSVNIDMARGLTDDDPDSESEPYRSEPVAGDESWTVTVRLALASFDVFTYWQHFRDGVDLMADVVWTGAELPNEAGTARSFAFLFPQLQLSGGFDASLGPRIGQTITFAAKLAKIDVAGMTDSRAPHAIVINEDDDDYIASI